MNQKEQLENYLAELKKKPEIEKYLLGFFGISARVAEITVKDHENGSHIELRVPAVECVIPATKAIQMQADSFTFTLVMNCYGQ